LDYKQLIAELNQNGASDLHLEPGLPPTTRIDGELKPIGDGPIGQDQTLEIAQELLNKKEWHRYFERNSCDLSIVINGVRCRVHAMKTKRGLGLAIRLLSSFQPTLEKLNLHPDLADLVTRSNGLIVVCGPTGSGKSSTLAGLLHEVSVKKSDHIVTIEQPVEYPIASRRSFVRQREVGVDTPSFEQALIDALREDPDLIMVGEMRTKESIQLTLNAAETGQLVLSTLHASNTAEAIQRIVSSFPSEIQNSVCSQLADCLVAVISQRLQFLENYQIRVPVCEILMASHPVRNLIRQGQFFKLASALETGHSEGSWTFRRYRKWIDENTEIYLPPESGVPFRLDFSTKELTKNKSMPNNDGDTVESADFYSSDQDDEPKRSDAKLPPGEVIVIDEPDEESLSDLLKRMDDSER